MKFTEKKVVIERVREFEPGDVVSSSEYTWIRRSDGTWFVLVNNNNKTGWITSVNDADLSASMDKDPDTYIYRGNVETADRRF